MFRPGEATPAYVEFTVEAPSGEPRGFLVLSTAEHDHPVVQLAHEGLAPSAELADKVGDHAATARVYRLSYDAYVAEDARGNLLGINGYLPGRVVGYDIGWLERDEADRAGHYRWDPESGVTEREAKVGSDVHFEAWPSWSALKAEYASNYAPLHALDRANAAEEWEIERTIEANGGTLQNGEFRELPLLGGRGVATVNVRGEGAAAVRYEHSERMLEGDMAVRVFVDTAPLNDVAPLDIDVAYADGTTETLRLNVTDTIPHSVLGMAAPSATRGTVRVRVSPVDAPGISCSKAVLMTEYGSAARLSGAELKTRGPWRTDDALVRIDHVGTGKVAFRASNNKYLRAEGGGGHRLLADASVRSTHETFTLYNNRSKPGFYGLQAHNRRNYVNFDSAGNVNVTTVRASGSRFQVDYCQPRKIYERWAGANATDAAKKVRKYDQLPARSAPSTSQCASGCGATAWAMLFGFHDYEAAQNDAKWSQHWKLFRRDGKTNTPNATAPEWFWRGSEGRHVRFNDSTPQPGVAAMVWEISQLMNDWTLAGCAPNGEKWTAPVIMGRAHQYLERRGVTAPLVSDYDGAGIMTHAGKTNAYGVIKKKQPVVIGIGHLSHYPLAVGRDRTEYRVWERNAKRWSSKADRRHFVVSMGWGRPHLQTVPYDTWMAGSLNVPEAAVSATTVNAEVKPVNPKPKPKSQHLPTQHTVKPVPHQKPFMPGGKKLPTPVPNF